MPVLLGLPTQAPQLPLVPGPPALPAQTPEAVGGGYSPPPACALPAQMFTLGGLKSGQRLLSHMVFLSSVFLHFSIHKYIIGTHICVYAFIQIASKMYPVL